MTKREWQREFRQSLSLRKFLGFGSCCPEKLSLQGLGIYRRPVELCLVGPALVDSRIDVVAERSVQIVVSGPLLQLDVQFQLLHHLSKPVSLFVSLRWTFLQVGEALLLLVQTTFPGLRGGSLMVAPDRRLQVRDPGMVQLDESLDVGFESVVRT